jgi:chemotaxis protein MotB
MANDQIIIIKKKKGHAAHHGGAWKVAYADFVTAMMAFFMVMWLMGSSKPIQDAVGGYFRDPRGSASKRGTGLAGSSANADEKNDVLVELEKQLKKSMEKMANFETLKKQIEMTATPEGLRIEMLEDANGTFFENGKAQPTPALIEVLKILSVETGKLPNPISIEGHTDAKPFSDSKTYGNWELSTDRSNAARRVMETSGLHLGQVVQVRGFADHNLRKPSAPEDASNRRISIIVQYMPQSVAPSTVFEGTVPVAKDLAVSKEADANPQEGKKEK